MTPVEVTYHRDNGRAHPAINVKVHAVTRSPEVDAAFPPSVADDIHEAVWEIAVERFWADAEDRAAELHLGRIWSEGRSGGWLAFEYDPQDHLYADVENDPDAMADEAGDEGEVARWLAGYAEMREWCEQYIAAVPADLRAMAHDAGMNLAGEPAAQRAWRAA